MKLVEYLVLLELWQAPLLPQQLVTMRVLTVGRQSVVKLCQFLCRALFRSQPVLLLNDDDEDNIQIYLNRVMLLKTVVGLIF